MATYFKATNDSGQTIIDDETSRLALLSKEYIWNLGVTMQTITNSAIYDNNSYTGKRNQPDVDVYVDYVLSFSFKASSTELLFAIKPLVKDDYIGYLVERISSSTTENNTKIWVILGRNRTHFTGTYDEEYINIAKNVEVYTFCNTKDASYVDMSYKDSDNNITKLNYSTTIKRGNVGVRIKNESGDYVFLSSLKYANIVASFSYSLNFSGYSDSGLGYPYSAFPHVVFTGVSSEHAISCNSYAGGSFHIDNRGVSAYPAFYAYTYGEDAILSRLFAVDYYLATYMGNISDRISGYYNLDYSCFFPSSKHMNFIAISTSNLFY